MNLNNIYIVLARPEESRNIGAACRAMANNSISNLRIVGKKSDFDEERVRILAIHAVDIWEKCQFFNSITEAVSDCSIAFGTTRRKGKKRKDKYYFPEDLSLKANTTTDNGAKVAIVFGNERTGLTDDELNECTNAVSIPSSDNFPSLNLSHAVQIISYHLFRQTPAVSNKNKFNDKLDYPSSELCFKNNSGVTPITLERLKKGVFTITENLKKIGFFKITGRDEQERFWTDILSRANLSEGEIKYLEKIFTKASGLSSK